MAPKLRVLGIAPAESDAESDAEPPPPPPPTLAQRRLIQSALPVIEKCAVEIAHAFRPRVTREELLGPGAIGADQAARKFDEEQHPDFLVYAAQYIRGRMYDAIRAEHVTRRARVEMAMERSFDRFTGHQLTDVDTFADPQEKIDASAREGNDDALAAAFFAAVLEARGASPEELAIELEGQLTTLQALSEVLATLPVEEREVLHLIYVEDMKVEDVAKAVRVSQKSVQRRHLGALRKLRVILLARGVTDPRQIDL